MTKMTEIVVRVLKKRYEPPEEEEVECCVECVVFKSAANP